MYVYKNKLLKPLQNKIYIGYHGFRYFNLNC
jgi:hypothetical protein